MCAMCGCNSEAFMGVELEPQSVYDVGATGLVSTPEMFQSESLNPLGASLDFRGSNLEMEDDLMDSEDMS